MATGSSPTYQPAIYREQGGSRMVVDSGGEHDILDGGAINIEAGGALTIPVVAGSTATTGDVNSIITFGSTAAATYLLGAPAVGTSATHLFCTAGATDALQVVDAGAGITFDGSKRYATFNAAGDAITIVGLSATRWLVMSNVGTVAFTTT